MKGKKNLGIVGFSYEVTNLNSQKTWITKREIGRKSIHKIEIAHGWNWSDEYWWGYGHSSAYLDETGPFYSIVGGYTDYTSKDSKSPFVKGKEWGEVSDIKFDISEGYDWNPFLEKEGYSRAYIYLLEHESVDNVLGGRIQSTSKDSSGHWFETNFFGKRGEKEINWSGSYGWSPQYWCNNGYNHFSLYIEDASKLDEKEEKSESKDDIIRGLQLQLEREKNKNKFLAEQLEEQTESSTQAQIQVLPKK